MKYILVLGINCKIFKKSPKIRVYMENEFVDEFDLSNNYINLPKNKVFFRYAKFPWTENIRLYEIDIKNRGDVLNFFIYVKNDDNNFTNGFMTKFTAVQLMAFQLIPKKIFLDPLKFRKRYKFNRKWFAKDAQRLKSWFKKKTFLFGPKLVFDWVDKNGKEPVSHSTDRGSSGYYHIQYKKKFGWYTDYDLGINRASGFDTMEIIKNKYIQYENKRNNN